jgi:hypothetical protein
MTIIISSPLKFTIARWKYIEKNVFATAAVECRINVVNILDKYYRCPVKILEILEVQVYSLLSKFSTCIRGCRF